MGKRKGKTEYADWMGASSDSDDGGKGKKSDLSKVFAEDKFSKREKKGHLLLQL